MSIFGSLFTAVSALSAQSQSISMISNNIANVSTVGYKRTDAAFSSLVTSESRSVIYSPGSVRATQNARVDEQGILQQSTSGTDIAISGNGFFVVKKSATDASAEPLYTRAGSFSEDSAGILQNTAGLYLMGWPLDQNGALPASQADLSSLVPVNVAFIGGLTQPTTSASSSLNLDATETTSAFPVTDTIANPSFSRDLRVFDSLGSGHNMAISFKKHESPTAIATGINDLSGLSGDLSANGFAASDDFDITVGAIGPTTITLDGPVSKLLADLNAIVDGNGDPVLYANLNPTTGLLQIKARNLADDITLADGSGTPLAGGLGLAAFIGTTNPPAAPTLLTATANVPNTEGWWDIAFSTPQGAVISEGSVNFNSDGTLNATPDSSGQVILNLTNIDWGNGSNLQDIEFDIASFSQFAGDYNVVSSNQNGAALGLRTGISVETGGYVTAQFSNGETKRLYKLAVATFSNPNGMDELTGNVFRQTDSSGTVNLREPGVGSAGQVQGGALEASNVDLAEEFSKMIVTQRAYSANTKVISTADQMTQELLQLR